MDEQRAASNRERNTERARRAHMDEQRAASIRERNTELERVRVASLDAVARDAFTVGDTVQGT